MLEALIEAGGEAEVAVFALELAAERMAQHRVGAQQLEHFAGHGAREAGEAGAVEQRPLAVGAGHHREAGKAGHEARQAQQLGFLAAHHVFGADIAHADAGQDARVELAGHVGPHGAGGQRAEISRGIEIGASIQPWRAPAMPQITTSLTPSASLPSSPVSTSGYCSRLSRPMPSGEERENAISPSPSMPQARRLEVPQSTATHSTCPAKFLSLTCRQSAGRDVA